MKFIFAAFIQLFSIACCGQIKHITGLVTDSLLHPLPNISITLTSHADTTRTATDHNGKFFFKTKVSQEFVIRIEALEFRSITRTYPADDTATNLLPDTFILKVLVKDLAEIVLSPTNPITLKEDTIEYKVEAYKVRDGSSVEDVLKKLPGVVVNREGTVTMQGKEIQAVRVNGKDYFGGDVRTATQNLPASIVENIQIIDDYGEKARHTGIKTGEPEKILNINIKKDKNRGTFGGATLGAGTRERYLMSLSANSFKDEKQLSVLASANNVNVYGHDANRPSHSGFQQSQTNGTPGINNVSLLTMHYRAASSTKLTSYGNYQITAGRNETNSESYLQDINPLNISSIRSNNLTTARHTNQRISWNLEYTSDSSRIFKFSPFISISKSQSFQRTDAVFRKSSFLTSNVGSSSSNDNAPSWGTDIFYLQPLKNKGTLTASANMLYTVREQNRHVHNDFYNVDSSAAIPASVFTQQSQALQNEITNTRANLHISLAKALPKDQLVEANYVTTVSFSESLREVTDVDRVTGEKTNNANQSNAYHYRFITNRIGLNVTKSKKQYNYQLGVAAQPSLLTGTDIRRSIQTRYARFNVVPSARFNYKLAQNSSITATYNGSIREPNFIQLQPVSDSSNLKNIISGNPNLRPEVTNRLSMQYNKADLLSGRTIFTQISLHDVQNKIVSSRTNELAGTARTTTFVNADGFQGISGSLSISQPFERKKFVLSVNASGNLDNNISFADGQRNTGSNLSLRPSVNLRIDLPDVLDMTAGLSYLYHNNTTRYPTYVYTSHVQTWQINMDGKYYYGNSWTLGYDLSKNIFTGYLRSFNKDPMIVNLFIERKLLKSNKAMVRVQGFDLLNENTGLSRSIQGTTIIDVQANRLSRYLMVSLHFRLQRFVK